MGPAAEEEEMIDSVSVHTGDLVCFCFFTGQRCSLCQYESHFFLGNGCVGLTRLMTPLFNKLFFLAVMTK